VNLAEFASMVRAHDGVEAFNEASRIAMAAAIPGRVEVVVADGPGIVAVAFAAGDAPVEFAVHPRHRRHGHATALLDRLLAAGESRFWAHGDAPAARRLAASARLEPQRTLLQLRWSPASAQPVASTSAPSGVNIRTFRNDDLPALLGVNSRAFADHPEQGTLDRDGFERRAQASWFRPDGLFVAERDGVLVGFHWTKLEGDSGEVYVLGVDPPVQGQGVARALLTSGLESMLVQGASTVDLYVEADNPSALALYRRHGFTEVARDVLYVSTTPAAAGHAPA
jgi:mycothiol synthase